MAFHDKFNLELPVMKILNKIKECNISMVIDTSGSMYRNFEVIRDVCVLFLKHFSYREKSSFNVISFSKLCASFSEGLVSTARKDNIILATAWIEALQCGAVTNTLSAIITAFDDNNDALVLFTDGLSTQKPSVFVKCITEVSEKRPVHIVYINLECYDTKAMSFLEQLTKETNGTFQVLCDTNSSKYIHCIPTRIKETSNIHALESPCDNIKKQLSEISLEDESNLLGNTVLAKKSTDGCYYKGVIVKQFASEPYVLVLFQSIKSNGLVSQHEDRCRLADVISYDPTSLINTMCNDDFVLVHLDMKGKYYPAIIKSMKYIYNEDDLSFTHVLEVELPNKERKRIPKSSAILITCTQYRNIVKEISGVTSCHCNCYEEPNVHSLQMKENKRELDRNKDTRHIIDQNLNKRIEKQVIESQLLMEKLKNRTSTQYDDVHLRSVTCCPSPIKHEADLEHYDSGFTDDDVISRKVRVPSTKPPIPSQDELQEDSTDGLIKYKSVPTVKLHPDKYMKKSLRRHYRATSAEPISFKEPHPPISWQTTRSSTHSKRSKVPHFRSASVGRATTRNVVERSKKHWLGRPIGKEMSPKRKSKSFYSEFHRNEAPPAEEYQTADGVPFPIRTDRRLSMHGGGNWYPDKAAHMDYQYHDIVAHRTVDYHNRSSQNDIKQNVKSVQKGKKEICKQKQRTDGNKQHSEDNKKRDASNNTSVKGCTKIHITIAKGSNEVLVDEHNTERSPLKNKQTQHENNETKSASLQADSYEQSIHKNTQTENFQVKRDIMQKKRIEKEIGSHEAKIDRLKELRKKTDARILYSKKHDKVW